MKTRLQEKWLNLSLREKQMTSLGVVAVIAFLFYLLIGSPLSHEVDSLRDQIGQDQTLLVWMRQADLHIEHIEAIIKTQHAANSGSLLSTVQAAVNSSPFAANISELRQGENNTVQLSLHKVSFDHLIAWLATLWQTKGLTVTQASVTPMGAPGVVMVTMTMTAH